jgi:hypothetical protein
MKQYGITSGVWQHGSPDLDSAGGREGEGVMHMEAGYKASAGLQMCEVWPISLGCHV